MLEIAVLEAPANVFAEVVDVEIDYEEVEVVPQEVIEVTIDDIEVVWLAEP